MLNLSGICIVCIMMLMIHPTSAWSTPGGNFVSVSTSRREIVASRLQLLPRTTTISASTSYGIGRASTTARRTTNSSTRLSMVFERMSEDCIVSLVTAQKESRKLGLKEVTNEVMLAGIVDRPERAKITLQQYGITWRKVTATLKEMYPSDSAAFNFFQSQAVAAEDLPFSKNLKTTMVAASKLADQQSSKTIHSEHVLMALLEYSPLSQSAAEPDLEKEIIECGALAVIMNSDGVDEDFTAIGFCQALQDNIKAESEEEENELVAAGGGSSGSKTPTLQECGVDLTQQARAGQLDPVYGRDDEIRSCLRTLVRRRKNNPCLIGGKHL
jgi:ATP-dependent Clp protease ATP-binding subunit ClpC